MTIATLLLVDDDAAFGAVLARALARRGVTVGHAADADAARRLLADGGFDAAVVDLNLAGDSGLALLPELRAALPGAPILMLTGFASIATAVDAIKLGASNYLAKPAGADDILAALGRLEPEPQAPVDAVPMSVRRLTWEHVQRVLADHDGNVSATARALNMHRRTLQRMLAKKPVGR